MTKRKTRLRVNRLGLSRKMFVEQLEDRSLLASDWQNPANQLDVDASGLVTTIDALVVINALGRDGSGVLGSPGTGAAPPPYLDVNGNGSVEPLDALAVI